MTTQQHASPPRIFNTQRIVHHRSRGDAGAILPLIHYMVEDMAERLSCIKRDFQNILEIWPLSNHIQAKLHDMYFNIQRYDRVGCALGEDDSNEADERHAFDGAVPLVHSDTLYDLVIAPLCGHFINDLPGVLHQIRSHLTPDGCFMMTLFGGDTLKELSHVAYKVMHEQRGGVEPLVAPFLTPQQGGMLLQRAGFQLPVVDRTALTVYYPDVFALLKDIQAFGGQASFQHPGKTLTPHFVRLMHEHYQYTFGESQDGSVRLPVTLEILTLSGWSPDESQQTPLRPHHAKARLRDYIS